MPTACSAYRALASLKGLNPKLCGSLNSEVWPDGRSYRGQWFNASDLLSFCEVDLGVLLNYRSLDRDVLQGLYIGIF